MPLLFGKMPLLFGEMPLLFGEMPLLFGKMPLDNTPYRVFFSPKNTFKKECSL